MKKLIHLLKWSLLVTLSLAVLIIIGLNVFSPSLNGTDDSARKYFNERDIRCAIHYIPSGQHNLRVIETGRSDPEAPLILFIHGAPGNWAAFRGYLADPGLRQRARLLSMDRIGYGQTSLGQSEKNIRPHAMSCLDIVNYFQPKSVILISHSYGGPIAAMATTIHGEYIGSHLMISPVIDPDNEKIIFGTQLINTQFFRAILPDFINVASDEKFSHAEALCEISDIWERITVPTIHMHAPNDKIAPYAENVAFSLKHINHGILEVVTVEDRDHFIPWNARDIVTSYIHYLLDPKVKNIPQ